MTDIVFEKFTRPLMALYKLNAPESEAFVAALDRSLAHATEYQLARAVEHVTKTRKSQYFPSIAECIEAVNEMPERDFRREPSAANGVRPASTCPPVVAAARRWLVEFSRATPEQRRAMTRGRPDYRDVCRRVVAAWERQDDGHKSMSDEDRAAVIQRLLGRQAA